MRSVQRFIGNLVGEWEQVRYFGAGCSPAGVIDFAPWPVRLEMAAKYAILGSTHRPWFPGASL